jgi:hypothetical protein
MNKKGLLSDCAIKGWGITVEDSNRGFILYQYYAEEPDTITMELIVKGEPDKILECDTGDLFYKSKDIDGDEYYSTWFGNFSRKELRRMAKTILAITEGVY